MACPVEVSGCLEKLLLEPEEHVSVLPCTWWRQAAHAHQFFIRQSQEVYGLRERGERHHDLCQVVLENHLLRVQVSPGGTLSWNLVQGSFLALRGATLITAWLASQQECHWPRQWWPLIQKSLSCPVLQQASSLVLDPAASFRPKLT